MSLILNVLPGLKMGIDAPVAGNYARRFGQR